MRRWKQGLDKLKQGLGEINCTRPPGGQIRMVWRCFLVLTLGDEYKIPLTMSLRIVVYVLQQNLLRLRQIEGITSTRNL